MILIHIVHMLSLNIQIDFQQTVLDLLLGGIQELTHTIGLAMNNPFRKLKDKTHNTYTCTYSKIKLCKRPVLHLYHLNIYDPTEKPTTLVKYM